ncbi:MAG: hypothetical protein EOP91_08985 [Lysobacteraceae bacterium]|nr:MAG: hypothetical protein EOP91_08985 [Xanthomonadaceae bacterium]
MDITRSPIQAFVELFAAMPNIQFWLVVLFLAFSAIAGNAVFALHYRRVGKPVVRSMLDLTSFPIAQFNRREWLLIGAVFAISMFIGVLAGKAG